MNVQYWNPPIHTPSSTLPLTHQMGIWLLVKKTTYLYNKAAYNLALMEDSQRKAMFWMRASLQSWSSVLKEKKTKCDLIAARPDQTSKG